MSIATYHPAQTSGYRVLAMDLYGRGLSPFPGSSSAPATPSRPVPKVRFTDALVTAQLQELLVQLKLSDASFTVIGIINLQHLIELDYQRVSFITSMVM